MDFEAVLWEEWIVFKRRFWKITSSALVSPLLYMIAFGWGMGKDVHVNGYPYINFIVPGIVAMTTMNTSYSAVSVLLSINRIYDKTFEQFLIAPISSHRYVAAKVLAGALRGMYAGFLILTVAFLSGAHIKINSMFLLIMFVNGLAFSCLGFYAALAVDSHADMNRFSTYILTPMTFLCGTFFSPENMPGVVKKVIYALPLTHASGGLRSIATVGSAQWMNVAVLFAYFIILFIICIKKYNSVTA